MASNSTRIRRFLIAFGIRQAVDWIDFFRGRGFDLFFYEKTNQIPSL